jgi:L-ribulose-5-phosphate 3-epimerase
LSAVLLGYNTNSLADHRLLDALDLIAEIGYRSAAITIDHGKLDRRLEYYYEHVDAVSATLDRHGLKSVIETGARFYLDPRVKHEPTLVSADPEARVRRVMFLREAIDVAQLLGSDCVSLWAGVMRDGAGEGEAWDRLVGGLRQVLDYADECGVILGFEPEPGMFIDTMARFEQLVEKLGRPEHLKLTLDVGHLWCQGETPIPDVIRRWAAEIVNVHIEDMRRGVHEHLPFGEGEMDFPPILAAFREIGYRGGLQVELPRQSHDGVNVARKSHDFLRSCLT